MAGAGPPVAAPPAVGRTSNLLSSGCVVDKNAGRRLLAAYAAILVLVALILVVGARQAIRGEGWEMLAAGSVGLIVVLCAWPLAAGLVITREQSERDLDDKLARVHERIEQVNVLLNLISENILISDRAKSIAFREKERDAVRRAISEEMSRGDWEAAAALAKEIEASFGYRQEAERLRQEIAMRQRQFQQRNLADALAVVDRMIRSEQWSEATAEAERLAAAFPGDPEVTKLPGVIASRRAEMKTRLLDAWKDAVSRKDVDGGIEILRQLDLYLSPSEAEALEPSAREVIREKLEALKARFAGAVHEHQWAEAIRLGEELIREFPNTRAAQEVREKMDLLRQRSEEPSSVA